MGGPVALLGGDEFLPSMEPFHRDLLGATGRPRPRVVVLFAPGGRGRTPATPDLRQRIESARGQFAALGAEVEEIVLRNRADADDESAAQAVGEADLVYVANGSAERLRGLLAGTRSWNAAIGSHDRGAVLAGCGGGAVVLAERRLHVGRRLGWPIHWPPGLGLCPSAGVLPSYDRMPEVLAALFVMHAPRNMTVLGIDASARIVGRDGAWQVQGPGRVTVWRGRKRDRLVEGDVFRL